MFFKKKDIEILATFIHRVYLCRKNTRDAKTNVGLTHKDRKQNRSAVIVTTNNKD